MKAIFLDRDGVINEDIGYPYKIDDWKFTHNCFKALKNITDKGYQIIIITNQAGMAKGYYSFQDYEILTKWYIDALHKKNISILDVFYCPHHPQGIVKELSIACECRKPKTGMIEQALQKYNINLEESILVGDRVSDIQAGINAGIGRLALLKSKHPLGTVPKHCYIENFNHLYDFSLTL